MRTLFVLPMFLFIILTGCTKNEDSGNHVARNDLGYLISQVIEGKDTTRFQYNNNNQLTGIFYSNGSFNHKGIFESFQYNSNGVCGNVAWWMNAHRVTANPQSREKQTGWNVSLFANEKNRLFEACM